MTQGKPKWLEQYAKAMGLACVLCACACTKRLTMTRRLPDVSEVADGDDDDDVVHRRSAAEIYAVEVKAELDARLEDRLTAVAEAERAKKRLSTRKALLGEMFDALPRERQDAYRQQASSAIVTTRVKECASASMSPSRSRTDFLLQEPVCRAEAPGTTDQEGLVAWDVARSDVPRDAGVKRAALQQVSRPGLEAP